ncbi:hypothetical protein BMETH_721_1 [methanotrophic bacterial endosymbiont of Bathymodiolus sp.]|nr:hypothetical protein BMETH_721_1 [methanotrophic bacterial endosymbiont of Bathymodiolus sp.]
MHLFAQPVKHFLLDFKIFKAHKLHVLQTLANQLCDWIFHVLKAFCVEQFAYSGRDGIERIVRQCLPRKSYIASHQNSAPNWCCGEKFKKLNPYCARKRGIYREITDEFMVGTLLAIRPLPKKLYGIHLFLGE